MPNSKEIFETLSKKFTQTADKVARKTDEIISIQKVKSQINSLEDQIDEDFCAIGEIIYGNHVAGEEYDADVTDLCLEVTMLRKEIVEMRDKLHELRGTSICAGCGAELAADAKFCSECGEKQPERKAEEAAEDMAEKAAEEAADEAAEAAEEKEEE